MFGKKGKTREDRERRKASQLGQRELGPRKEGGGINQEIPKSHLVRPR